MKIAYLIAAHNDPAHLKRLIEALNVPDITDFYVHIDKRADIQTFNISYSNVTIIPARILVQWGGYSQCRYQKSLIKACLSSGKDYDRVFFLSGLDYPYWSNHRIISFLESNSDKEYICGMNVTDCMSPHKIREKITIYHYMRDLPLRNARLKRFFSGSLRLIMKTLPLRKKPYIMIDDYAMNVYMGSSWWCITGKCLKYVDHNVTKEIEQYFKTSFAPDEMMIQTVVFNSPYRDKAINYNGPYPGLVGLTPLHLIDYNGSIKVFKDSDMDEIKKKDKMFIRKTVTGVSDSLLDKIDNMRNT